jgi:hypothetical protein
LIPELTNMMLKMKNKEDTPNTHRVMASTAEKVREK